MEPLHSPEVPNPSPLLAAIELRACRDIASNPHEDDWRVLQAIDYLTRNCHKDTEVELLLGHGLVDLLLEIAEMDTETRRLAVPHALRTLGNICFQCRLASKKFHQTEGWVRTINHCLQGIPEVQSQAWYVLQQIASGCWGAHNDLLRFVDGAINTMQDQSIDDITRGRSVRFCSHISCNELMATGLAQRGVLGPLQQVMNSDNLAIGSTSATVAVCALSGSNLTLQSKKAQAHVIGAFLSAVRGQPYPPNTRVYPSPWRYALAVASLAVNKENHKWMRDSRLVDALTLCLSEFADPKSVRYALRTLWLLSAP